ncbi:hypothetical protein BS47DRAFT_10391 [Hydnum rufescens UP504]|uniref:Uncharacterized protein n=1 Tax=Hydnum rufescens UP504 TaxID=1448309 RepID=A0A9P6BCC2_9AGAM|nr:hypothetical protein BS47DRAFT_10391 [Hydnum rufescens UP504]
MSMAVCPWLCVHGCVSMAVCPWLCVHGCASMAVRPWLCIHGCVVISALYPKALIISNMGHDKAEEEPLISPGSESSSGRPGLLGFVLADRSMSLPSPLTKAMSFDTCLKLHFHFCLWMYLSSPPHGAPLYEDNELNHLLEQMGLYEPDERLLELLDPQWDSPFGREVLQ